MLWLDCLLEARGPYQYVSHCPPGRSEAHYLDFWLIAVGELLKALHLVGRKSIHIGGITRDGGEGSGERKGYRR